MRATKMKNQQIQQAIRTKYHGPTERRGSRYTATAASGIKCTIPAPLHLDGEERKHRSAAEALAAKLGWTGRMVCGGLSDGYVFVFAD